MRTANSAKLFLPSAAPTETDLAALRTAAAGCRGCELHERATQTVFGDGATPARVMLVGEQPGDVEDRRGEPFVGPAGRLLDQALAEAGLERNALYVTNAVKHFRWKATASGKRRLHQRPDAHHVDACRPWLSAEIAVVRPRVVVALGATATQSLFGSGFRLTTHRGERLGWPPERGPYAGSERDSVEYALTTIHPSAVLRAGELRGEVYDSLVEDLRQARPGTG